ncbi:hypothetical protein, partial [Lactobacillus delbrueckii]|uniref:hypothetical protein n=1 Tax=Lactobacillus delbrueckii TaxID=1584 RepID=UPI0021A679BD
LTPNLTAFTGVDSQNLPDVMVSVQFILAIGEKILTPPHSTNHTFPPANRRCFQKRMRYGENVKGNLNEYEQIYN